MQAKARVLNEKALTANPEKVIAYATKLETYLRCTNMDLTKSILTDLIVHIRIRSGEQKGYANVNIRYRVPTPPTGWTEKTDMEVMALRKNMRSLDTPGKAGIQVTLAVTTVWIPACAGMTGWDRNDGGSE